MFTGQLNSIVDYVAQLQELDTTDVEPLAHGIEVRNVFRDDVRGAGPAPRGRARSTHPSGTRRASWSRPCWSEPVAAAGLRPVHASEYRPSLASRCSHRGFGTGRRLMKHATATALLAQMNAGAVTSEEIVRGYLDRAERLKRLNVFVHLDREHVLAQARADRRQAQGRRAGRAAGGRAGGDQGRALRRGRADDLRQPDAPELPAPLRRHGDRPAQGGRRDPLRQDEHGRVRDGLVDREQRLRPDAEPLGRGRGCPAARRAARPRPWPPTWRRWRSAPTPAARSASRPPSAASSGSSRPTAASAATA